MPAPFYLPQLRPCRLAVVGNISNFATGAPNTVDGQLVAVGDRILPAEQTVGTEIGIYVVKSVGTGADGTWVRADDLPRGANNIWYPGSRVYVAEGTKNGGTWYNITNSGAITIGTTSLTLIQEAPLVRTDATAAQIKAATTPFTSGSIVWSDALNMRDFKEVSVWLDLEDIGSNTQVDLYYQWSDDGSNIPFDDNNGIQQTDFLLSAGTDGIFKPKDYVARLTTTSSPPELVTGKILQMTYPKKGGSFRFGAKGNSATGTFGVKAQRLA